MLGEQQSADADEHDQCRDYDTVLVRSEYLATVCEFIRQSLGHEDGVVVALAGNERGQYHIDNVELYTQHSHYSQYPDPAESHRHERDYRKFDASQ